MFDKTLTAVAVAGTLVTGSAFAADVSLYGLVDYSLNYQYHDSDTAAGGSTDQLQLKSGANSGSRFGVKGVEEISPGFNVGFVLENGFDADTGSLSFPGRIFGREAQAYLQGSFGTISVGRVGQLASANGSYGLLGVVSPFSSGWGDSTGVKYVTGSTWTRFDNTVTLVSPEFAGVKIYAQYSFGTDGTVTTGDEGHSSVDRYYGIGATYQVGNLNLVGVVDSINYATPADASTKYVDDSLTVSIGGNYNFGVATAYLFGQYFDNAKTVGYGGTNKVDFNTAQSKGAEGYSVALGVGVPAFGGTAKFSVGYLDAQAKEGTQDIQRYNAAVGYDYQLTKRTSFYSAASYTKDNANTGINPNTVEVQAGIIHKF